MKGNFVNEELDSDSNGFVFSHFHRKMSQQQLDVLA